MRFLESLSACSHTVAFTAMTGRFQSRTCCAVSTAVVYDGVVIIDSRFVRYDALSTNAHSSHTASRNHNVVCYDKSEYI